MYIYMNIHNYIVLVLKVITMTSSYSNTSSSILIHLLILLTMAPRMVAWPTESGSTPFGQTRLGTWSNYRRIDVLFRANGSID